MQRLNIPTSPPDKEELAHYLKENALAIMMEGAELQDWNSWKHWSRRSGNKQVAESDLFGEEHLREIKMEVVDLLHFVLEHAVLLGMTAEDLASMYFEKNAVNHDRQERGDY